MNVREMHIEIQQAVQQVAANRSRRYRSEELDLVINKMINRFIQGCLRPRKDAQGRETGGFELDQLSTDKIRNLVVAPRRYPVYISDKERYFAVLPPDYAYLISDSSYVTELCGAVPVEEKLTRRIYRLRQDYSTKSAAPYYVTLSLQLANKAVTVPADLPYGHKYVGYSSKEDISFLVPWIAQKAEVYWERYHDLYYPGHYIQVSDTAASSPLKLIVDGIDITPVVTEEQKDYLVHNAEGRLVANRLTPSEMVTTLNRAQYYKTAAYAPISEITGNTLWIYRDGSFTVNGISLTYVRKPQLVSLSLGTDCDLAPEFHQSICDLAVEYLKGNVENREGLTIAKTDLAERVTL